MTALAAVSSQKPRSCLYKDKWTGAESDQRERAHGNPPAERSAKRLNPRRADTRSEKRRKYAETILPKHVRHCSATGARDWAIYTWDKQSPSRVTRTPYLCSSWRCPICRRHEAAVSFARTKAAFEGIATHAGECGGKVVPRHREPGTLGPTCWDCEKCGERCALPDEWDPSRLGFFVLTIDRNGFYSGEIVKSAIAAYAAMGEMARAFMRRLQALARAQRVEAPGARWVATVEAHKSGWPHYQLAIYLPPEWTKELPEQEGFKPGWSNLADQLRKLAVASGWGWHSSFERCRDAGATMGYLIGTAGKHEASVGELSKLTQLPLNALPRFRRLRSGKGFLPPRWKGSKTGTLIRRQRCHDGTFQAMALHELKSPQAREVSAQCCYHEERVWEAERGFGRLLRPEMLALMPGLKEELLPRLSTFAVRPPARAPPIAEPTRHAGAVSWEHAALPFGCA